MGTLGTGDGVFGRFLKKFFFIENKNTTMASSYVEVRDTENGTENEVLPFGIETCDSNGLELPVQVEEPPKDHTYNKDPVVVQEGVDEPFETLAEEEIVKVTVDNDVELKKPARSARNVKPHKFIKARNIVKAAKSSGKKESPSRKGARRKIAPVVETKEVVPEFEEKAFVEAEDPPTESVASPIEDVGVENVEDNESAAVEQSPQKKKGRKRKTEADVEKEVVPAKRMVEPSPKKEKAVEPEVDIKEKIPEPESLKKEPQKKVKAEIAKDSKKHKISTTKNSAKEKAQKPSKKEKAVDTNKGNTSNDESSLPKGWTRKVVERKSGKTAGLFDIYIYSPEGIKFRSRPDIAAYLAKTKSNLKVEDFNFTKRSITVSSIKSQGSEKRKVQPGKIIRPSKPIEKISSKPKKKATGSGKRGQKLVVKLNFTTPKKRILSDYEKQKSTEKSKHVHKAVESKPNAGVGQKRTGGNRRKKMA